MTCDVEMCAVRSLDDGASPHPHQKQSPTHRPQGLCEDEEETTVKINGQVASCSDLRPYCETHGFVKEQCCATCVSESSMSGWGSEGDCEDASHVIDLHSDQRHCSEMAHICEDYEWLRQKCCATCKAHQDKDLTVQHKHDA